MSKKTNDDLENIEIIGDGDDDLSDVKRQLKKLKKESEDLDEGEEEVNMIEEDEPENETAEDIVINEENTLPFSSEEKYYKSFEKFLSENQEE